MQLIRIHNHKAWLIQGNKCKLEAEKMEEVSATKNNIDIHIFNVVYHFRWSQNDVSGTKS